MLDIKYIKENPDEVIARLAKKGKDAREEINQIISLDAQRRELIQSTETLKAEKNKTSKLIPQYKKEGKDTAEIFARMKELGLNEEDYWWYMNLRKYGGTKHAGFGLGFERIIMYITGVSNIRDVLPYPRTVGNAEF